MCILHQWNPKKIYIQDSKSKNKFDASYQVLHFNIDLNYPFFKIYCKELLKKDRRQIFVSISSFQDIYVALQILDV